MDNVRTAVLLNTVVRGGRMPSAFINLSRYAVLIAFLLLNVCSVLLDRAVASGRVSVNGAKCGVIIDYLESSLWKARDAYDAGYRLMVPLHWAIMKDNEVLIEAFEHHFDSLLKAYKNNEVKLNAIQELQYITLVSRYLAEAPRAKSVLRDRLYSLVKDRFLYFWETEPAWMWDRDDFKGGIKERIRWKLKHPNQEKSYYGLIIDQDIYTLGLAADLITASPEQCEECNDAISLFIKIMDVRLNEEEPGWVFQRGCWTDHSTYAYSGYLTEPPDQAEKLSVIDIQSDASHAKRWPLWFRQMSNHMSVAEWQRRMRHQIFEKVLVDEFDIGVPVFHNFVSGHNGYYRWNYHTHSTNQGYGPYQLSGSIIRFGWYALLGDSDDYKVSALYKRLLDAYPLNSAQRLLYRDLSTRDKHPMAVEAFEGGNDMEVCIASMAVDVADDSL